MSRRKSTRRKSPKRKSRRKSTRRKSPKRKSRRKSTRRKSPKRKSRRKSARRKSTRKSRRRLNRGGKTPYNPQQYLDSGEIFQTKNMPKEDPAEYLDWTVHPSYIFDKEFWKYFFKPLDHDDPKWSKIATNLFKKYKDKYTYEKDEILYLRKGVKLYHGSRLDSTPNKIFTSSNRITFFGTDPSISLWYLLETCSKTPDLCDSKFPCNSTEEGVYGTPSNDGGCYTDPVTGKKKRVIGYLYTMEVVKDMPVKKYWDFIYRHPSSVSECKSSSGGIFSRSSSGVVCMHPQISYRGPAFSSSTLHDISIEITLPYQKYKKYLKLVDKRKVNVSKLAIHINDPYFNPQDAIENKKIEVGGDSDEHGCKMSAGYSWCESLEQCIRPWETKCPT